MNITFSLSSLLFLLLLILLLLILFLLLLLPLLSWLLYMKIASCDTQPLENNGTTKVHIFWLPNTCRSLIARTCFPFYLWQNVSIELTMPVCVVNLTEMIQDISVCWNSPFKTSKSVQAWTFIELSWSVPAKTVSFIIQTPQCLPFCSVGKTQPIT